MTIDHSLNQPRARGKYSDKVQGGPQIDLAYPELPQFEPAFFYDRVSTTGTSIQKVKVIDLSEAEQALVRNATQSTNDSWALDNGVYNTSDPGDWTETTVYRDGELLIADVQHKNQDEAPFGILVAFDSAGNTVGQHSNVSDEFGERWTPTVGLPARLLIDLNEASQDGSLGDQL